MTAGRRRLLAALVLGIGLASCVERPAPAVAGPAPVLEGIRADGQRLIDSRGREVLLRGFHHIALRSNRFRPADPHAAARELFNLRDLELADFRAIAAMGLNSVRLPITWEFAQPDPPPAPFNGEYFELLDRALARARRAGVNVILDFAQFGYSRATGGNAGAPAWTVPEACRQLPGGRMPGLPPQGTPRTNCAFTALWENENRIQDEYVRLWRFIAERYRWTPGIALYDLFNEPQGGFLAPVMWERDHLHPFYRRLAAAVREVDPQRAVGFQPYILHSAGLPPLYVEPIGVANAVYTAHNYTSGFVGQQLDPSYPAGQTRITREDFRATAREARRFGTPFLNGETGWVRCAGDTSFDGAGPPNCDEVAPVRFASDLTAVADELLVGWHWSEYSSDPADATRAINPRGELDARLARALARPYPQATAGRVLSVAFDEPSGRYVQRTSGAFRAPSEIALPLRWRFPAGACARVDGRVVAAVRPRGRVEAASRGVRFDRNRQVLVLPWIGSALRIDPGTTSCRVPQARRGHRRG